MTNDDKAFPPPPEKDEKIHIQVTEGLKTILGTGGPPPVEQDPPSRRSE